MNNNLRNIVVMMIDEAIAQAAGNDNVVIDMSNRPRGSNQQIPLPPPVEEAANRPDYGYVSTQYKCQTKDASDLCIYDMASKLKQENIYDIGGTYTENDSDFWFYYTSTACPKRLYLLNLFVCPRKIGNFSIGISSSNHMVHTTFNEIKRATLPNTRTWYQFKTAQCDENLYIKTFCLTENDVKELQNNTLFIPLTIKIDPKFTLNSEILKSLKLQYDLGNLLSRKEKADFVLKSASGTEFPAHKIILAAHSPVLRSLVKNTSALFLDINDNHMELLLNYIYTGTINDISKQDSLKLLDIVDKFQLKPLFMLTQHLIGEQINVKNAVEVALIAKKYNLEELQSKVFNFIKNNPEVMSTDGWQQLDDVELTKRLFQHVHKMQKLM